MKIFGWKILFVGFIFFVNNINKEEKKWMIIGFVCIVYFKYL